MFLFLLVFIMFLLNFAKLSNVAWFSGHETPFRELDRMYVLRRLKRIECMFLED